MVDSNINAISLELWVKTTNFYNKSLVQVRNGVFRYHRTNYPNELSFQSDLSDIIIIESAKDIKAELLLSSKSNNFSVIKLSHEDSHLLYSFKVQLERLIEQERHNSFIESEKMKNEAKMKKLKEIIERLALTYVNDLPIEIKEIMDRKYEEYKDVDDVKIETTSKERLISIDKTVMLYDQIYLLGEYTKTIIESKKRQQRRVVYCISLYVILLSIIHMITKGSCFQVIMSIVVIIVFSFKIKDYIIQNMYFRVNNSMGIQPEKIIKSNTMIQMNMFQLFEYIIEESKESLINNKRHNILSNEKLDITFNSDNNLLIIIEYDITHSYPLNIYSLETNHLTNVIKVTLYCMLYHQDPIDYQRNSLYKLYHMIRKIKHKEEDEPFNHNESFLFHDEIDYHNSIINDNEHNDANHPIELTLQNIKTNLPNIISKPQMMLDYHSIIQFNDETLLKEEIIINIEKSLVLQFISNCHNLQKVNGCIRNVLLNPEDNLVEFLFEFKGIGDIFFNASVEVTNIEIEGIDYTVMGFTNVSNEISFMQHFGFAVKTHEDKGSLVYAWVKIINTFYDDKEEDNTYDNVMIAMNKFLSYYHNLEENIQFDLNEQLI